MSGAITGILCPVFVTGEISAVGVEKGIHRIIEDKRFTKQRPDPLGQIEEYSTVLSSKKTPQPLLRRGNAAGRSCKPGEHAKPFHFLTKRACHRLAEAKDTPIKRKAIAQPLQSGTWIGIRYHSKRERPPEHWQGLKNTGLCQVDRHAWPPLYECHLCLNDDIPAQLL